MSETLSSRRFLLHMAALTLVGALLAAGLAAPDVMAVSGTANPSAVESQVQGGTGFDDPASRDRVIASRPGQPFQVQEEQGMSMAELMRNIGVAVGVLALFILVVVEFFYRHRLQRSTYRWLLLFGLFMLPVLVGLSAISTVMEETKTVESCASCHVMEPFVGDLMQGDGTTLASRHYENRWIERNQCYACHTSYGAHGTLEGKRDGFRHWALFVTGTWEEPISYAGSYPNVNCTSCHGGTPAFENVISHRALASEMRMDKVTCTRCHGPAHPTPKEREQWQGQQTEE